MRCPGTTSWDTLDHDLVVTFPPLPVPRVFTDHISGAEVADEFVTPG